MQYDNVATEIDESEFGEPEEGLKKANNGLYIRFYTRPVMNKRKSWGGIVVNADGTQERVAGEGRAIFEDKEFIEIAIPADKTLRIDKEVTAKEKRIYAQQYAAWKSGQQEQLVGTPLSQWPLVTRAQAEELAYQKVRTVEQLAAISDGNLHGLGPNGRKLRDRAHDWLETAKGHAPVEQLRGELEAARAEIAAMKASQVAAAENAAKAAAETQKHSRK